MTPDDAQIWQAYWTTRGTAERNRLVERYWPVAVATAKVHCRRFPAADFGDVLGAAGRGLMRAVEGYDPAGGTAFRAAAVQGCRNGIVDDYRARDGRRRVATEPAADWGGDDPHFADRRQPDPAAATAAAELAWLVRAAVASLRDPSGWVVWRTLLDGLLLSEVAAEIDVSEPRACSLRREGLDRLRPILARATA